MRTNHRRCHKMSPEWVRMSLSCRTIQNHCVRQYPSEVDKVNPDLAQKQVCTL